MRIGNFFYLLPIVLFIFSCSKGKNADDLDYVMREELLMDTIISIRIPESPQANNIINSVFEEFKRIENKFSKSIESSVVYKINNRNTDIVKIDKEEEFILKKSFEYNKITEGYFDITVFTIGQFWDFNLSEDSNVLNSLKKSEENFKYVGTSNIFFDSGTIGFKNKFIKIDLGGIAKGYAIDRAVEILKNNNISGAVINAGGDVFVVGKKNKTENWNIAIQDPDNTENYLKILNLYDKNAATSGDYQRYVFFENKYYCHIFNPKTGKNSDFLRSATVVYDTALISDIIATAVIASETEYKTLIKKILEIHPDMIIYVKNKENDRLEEYFNSKKI
ncbi:FAD:protein FMN transferase [Candidatus Dependentiae bacterium]|nr:FAD:protein FMN transferase [Candidatus Dependentiae bacterium]